MKNARLVEFVLADKSNLCVKGGVRSGVTSVLNEVIVQAQLDHTFDRIVAISEEHGFRMLGLYNGLVKYTDAGQGLDYVLTRVVEGSNVMCVIDDVDIAVKNSVTADKLVALAKGHKCKLLLGRHKNYIDVPLIAAINSECSTSIVLERDESGIRYNIDGSWISLERC